MRKTILPLFAIALLFACNAGPMEEAMDITTKGKDLGYLEDAKASEEAPPPPPEGNAGLTFNGTASNASTIEQVNEPMTKLVPPSVTDEVRVKVPEKIIKTADLRLLVEDYKKSRLAVEKIVKGGNAYISAENEQNNSYSISNNMVIRVLNKDFDRVVSELTDGSTGEVEMKNIHTDDVTAEFVDITARLKTKKQVEERYIELLKKAGKITDILEVEEKIRVIREEIEATEGRLKLLNDQVSYSTINLNFYQTFEHNPIDKPGFLHRMGNAFSGGWQGLLGFIVGIAYAWPLWLILGIGGTILYKFIHRMIKK